MALWNVNRMEAIWISGRTHCRRQGSMTEKAHFLDANSESEVHQPCQHESLRDTM